MTYSIRPIDLKLKTKWKISRNESVTKRNFILSDGLYFSEIAPNIRYNETPERILNEFNDFISHPDQIDKSWSQAFLCGVRNLKLKQESKGQLAKALKLKELTKVKTSFSIPIMDKDNIKQYLSLNPHFYAYKVKIENHHSIEFLNEIAANTNALLRIDANEGFNSLDDYLFFEKEISHLNIEFIEQPFPAERRDLYLQLRPNSKFLLIADESVTDQFDANEIRKMFHGVNIKLMKSGGLLKAKSMLEEARKYHLKTMIGCMIESSLGISEAFYLAQLCDFCDLDGHLLIENDPYKDLLKLDKGQVELSTKKIT
jgi:glutamate racemase